MSYTYEHPRPALTVDCVVFGWDGAELQVLLIERAEAPFMGNWALPGGFVHMDETLDDAAQRELQEETGLADLFLEQLFTFGALDRDPRGRVVTVAYYALVNIFHHEKPQGGTDASQATWFPMEQLPTLAFDHTTILNTALERLRGKILYRPIGFELLPEKFSFTQLQELYEGILGTAFDRRNFRKKILSMGILNECGKVQGDVPHRKATLYKFDEPKYKQLEMNGFEFKI
jgi:8-oxo-dGTP diphosphatase